MSYRGKVIEVFDKETKSGKKFFTVLIDTAEKGEVKFNLFDLAYEDVIHQLEGSAVTFEAKPGQVRDETTGERWPSTLTAIMAEGEYDESSSPPRLPQDEGRDETHEALQAVKAYLEAGLKRINTLLGAS